MFGREQREEGENRERIVTVRQSGCGGQHMRSVPLSATRNSLADGGGDDSSLVRKVITTISSDSFCKDGRKISVGECALFKPSLDSPPFIGIIRCLRSSKENNLQLGVNWLYRPVELKLGKGILLDATPNEIFYSFHKDEIPAVSLLHPCRVAFLPKDIELPTGTSSFVCRRVYDIENKCLWWLTDQDYINERQEEVDKLLEKTRLEMDASFQPGNRSPKPTNGSLSTLQVKPGSDNVQVSATSVPSQTKGKKRERGDQFSDAVKRERPVRPDDGDSGLYRSESSLRSEIAKMTEKGGLVDSESVEKLVHLMQLDKVDKKIDLISCSMLAGIIAATDKFDCLNQFVQLKGLPVFDEWLQDVHKVKISDGASLKDGGKSAEDFVLVLLRALDKLPVNLHALQTCNIGRSVNNLRSHKNLEIQKKARSLVDTWKKRVEAEMNIIDAKSGSTQAASWPSKPRLPEAHGGKNSGGSGEVAFKSSIAQLSASKTMSVKVSQVETAGKSVSISPGAIKAASSPVSGKEGQPRITAGSASDVPLSIREDKGSSSSQSHNCSPSFTGKEDARSTAAGSTSVSKLGGGSRHRKSVNGFPGTSVSGSHKETTSARNSSIHRNTAQEKFSPPVLMGEKASDVPLVEGSTHKLIVKISNRGRSPAQSVSGGSFEDPSIMSSRGSSPVLSDQHEECERNIKEKGDACRATAISNVNAESCQSDDFRDLLTGSDEGDGSPAAPPNEERSKTVEDASKVPEAPKAASSSSGNDVKCGKLNHDSFSSMNALIESCVKYSEVNTSMALVDDVGMNLLASVAAGEMCKADLLTLKDSPRGCTRTLPVEECRVGEDFKSKSIPEECLAQAECQPNDDGGDDIKQGKPPAGLGSKDGTCQSKLAVESCGDRKATSASSEESLQAIVHGGTEINEKFDGILVSKSLPPNTNASKDRGGDTSKHPSEENVVSTAVRVDDVRDVRMKGSCSLSTEAKLSNVLSSTEDFKNKAEIPSSKLSMQSDCIKNVNDSSKASVPAEQKPAVKADGEVLAATGSVRYLIPEPDENCGTNCINQSEEARVDSQTNKFSTQEDQNPAGLRTDGTDQKPDCSRANTEKKEVAELHSFGSCAQTEAAGFPPKDVVRDMDLREPKTSSAIDGKEEQGATVVGSASVTAAHALEMDLKVNFDLNEGLLGDDGKDGEPINLAASGCLSNAGSVNPLSPSVSLVASSIPSSITVAAAAKGPFLPPVDLLRIKGELGWKGSAATSAFRPAEPRKVLQLPLGSPNVSPLDDSATKPCRPPLDIDLNVLDEQVLEEMACRDSTADIGSTADSSRNELAGSAPGRSFGGLDLDLNRVDDANDVVHCSTSSSLRLDAPVLPLKALSSSSLTTSEVRRDFDLNNGPGFDDAGAEQSSFNHGRGATQSVRPQPPLTGLRSNNLDAGNFSAWFPPGTSYSSISVPSALTDRGEPPFPIIPVGAPQRILGPGGNPFTSDVYRGSVLSSSPALPFPPSPFPYQMFPFGATLSLPSATFSVASTSFMDSTSGGRIFTQPVNSQFLGPVGAVSSQYPRPYMVSLSDGSNNGGVENIRKWSRQGLDLNAGPGVPDIEGREETLAQRQLIGSSQALAEDQARMFPLSGGGVLKRKEPEGGWDAENFRYKQSS